MSLAEPWVVAGLAIGVATFFATQLRDAPSASERQRRAMRNLPALPLNETELGVTAVILGHVRTPSALLESPLERRACCAYRLLVWDTRGDTETLVLDTAESSDLYVEAAGLAASIRSPSIVLEGRGDPHYSGHGARPTGAQTLIIERYGLKPTNLTYREYILCPGDAVRVVATLSSEEAASFEDAKFNCAGSGGYRSRSRRRVLVGDKFPLTVVAPGGEL